MAPDEIDDRRDPVIEALVLDVDMSLVRRNLAMTPQRAPVQSLAKCV